MHDLGRKGEDGGLWRDPSVHTGSIHPWTLAAGAPRPTIQPRRRLPRAGSACRLGLVRSAEDWTGNHIGHLARDHHRSFDVASIIGAVFALGLAVWLDTTAGLTPAALYALAAAVVGVVVVHVAHEGVRYLAPAVRVRIGLVMIVVTLGLSLLVILNPPSWLRRFSAEGLAAFAAVGVSWGSTVMGHGRGQQLQAQAQQAQPEGPHPAGPIKPGRQLNEDEDGGE
jgi:hypothetical protein